MTTIVVGPHRRGAQWAPVLVIGLLIGVALGAFVRGALMTADAPAGRREARPGEVCECWVRP